MDDRYFNEFYNLLWANTPTAWEVEVSKCNESRTVCAKVKAVFKAAGSSRKRVRSLIRKWPFKILDKHCENLEAFARSCIASMWDELEPPSGGNLVEPYRHPEDRTNP